MTINKEKELSLNPINALNARNLTEVLGVVRYNSQAKVASCDGYHDVKIANNNALTGERLAYLGIVMSPIGKWQDSKMSLQFP